MIGNAANNGSDTLVVAQQEFPSDTQDLILAILPIPSSLLSIAGSSVIIFMAFSSRRQRKWSPYTRLLVAMSLYDIVSSVNLAVATFARPEETSLRPYSFGNEATCSAVGFLNQVSYASLFYNAMLSFYFLLTARYGFSNVYIASRVEPWMHVISILFPLVTATVALILGAYDESSASLGCWVGNYPRGCDDGPGGQVCTSVLMGWVFYGGPVIIVFACLVVNNSIILMHVRQNLRPLRKRRLSIGSAQLTTVSSSNSVSGRDNNNEELAKTQELTHPEVPAEDRVDPKKSSQSRQGRRLRLVSSQAFLFVASFLVCNVWSTIGALIESLADPEEEMQLVTDYYSIFVLQAALTPLQGLFNMLVYMRPKYWKCRQDYPKESRLWTVRRTIFGSRVKRTKPQVKNTRSNASLHSSQSLNEDTRNDGGNKGNSQPIAAPLNCRQMVSSLTIEDQLDCERNDCTDAIKRPLGKEMTNSGQKNQPCMPFGAFRNDMQSSLTVSHGDFDYLVDDMGEDSGQEDDCDAVLPESYSPVFFTSLRTSSAEMRSSALEVISEGEVTTFDPSVISSSFLKDKLSTDASSRIEDVKRHDPSGGKVDTRWNSGGFGLLESNKAGERLKKSAPSIPMRWTSESDGALVKMDRSVEDHDSPSFTKGDAPAKQPRRQNSPTLEYS